MLRPFIAKAINRVDLSSEEAQDAMNIIMTGQATPAQIGAYLVALRMKGETVDEITGSSVGHAGGCHQGGSCRPIDAAL